ncbi:MAG TPA: D-aminoacylase [Thermoanaerobaculia bacterium]|nr:D-aminoacylase [Thermoanaerobaculia bacterium]HQR66149.1 D-aminoacylase [Thermoanaerobaculia bacterium]
MKRAFSAAALSAAAFFLLSGASSPADRDDLVFENGRVADGTGAPLFRADVAVRGDRIVAVGLLPEARKAAARRRIDASGLVVSPGFIDLLGQSEYNVLVDRRAASKITQGITTEVTGEGSSIAPSNERILREGEDVWRRYGVRPDFTTLAGYFARFRRSPPAINLGTFVGLGTVRDLVIGKEDRRATPAELEAMEREVAKAMEAGALGVSTSLQYVPDMYNSTEEIVAMARVAARYGGVWFTHQRSEGNRIDASLDEVFRVAREARIPANIWHLKTAYRRNWGRMPAVLARLEAARAEGLDVAANQYPWAAASNGLDACLPPWVREGGADKLVARLKDPAVRERVKREMAEDSGTWENQWYGSGGAAGVLVAAVLRPELKAYEGKTLEEIGRAEGKDPRDALIDLVVADRGAANGIIYIMDEGDVRAALRSRLVAFCTDTGAAATDGIYAEEKSHPRGWASTARILGTYVRDEKLLPLEEAVRKMTSLSAARAQIRDRGVVAPGLYADLVAFDPARVKAVSTFADPLHYCEGIPYVAVNGQLVVDGGRITSARPGRIVAGPGLTSGR